MSDGPPDSQADAADMANLAADQPAALNGIIARHGATLHAYLLRVLQQAEDAADLAQETFARVYLHRARYDQRRPFKTWLYAIATNLARDRIRWRMRHPESSLDQPRGDTNDSPALSLADPGSGPADLLQSTERARAVRSAVAELPEDLKVPLILSEFENLAHAEIAGVLGCSAKAVEMRLYRARQILRKQLQGWILE